MLVNQDDINIIKGAVSVTSFERNEKGRKIHHCNECGTPIWFSVPVIPGICALKPGTLKDKFWAKPVAQLWMRSSQPWLSIDDDAKKFEI